MLDAAKPTPELPYNPVSHFFKGRFGEKVFKIPVSIAEDCPNRAGLKGMKTCIFCDEHGSFAYPENLKQTLEWQISTHKQKVGKRYNANKFVVYFQAYTTTYTQLKRLREAFELALEHKEVVGIVVGTRPDCLSAALLDLWQDYAQKTFISVEFGVQSFDDKQLEWMRRGHDCAQTIKAINKVKEKCPDVNIGVHLMFGWPGETIDDVVRAATYCSDLKVDSVKLHNLHVLKNTPLEQMYNDKKFKPIDLEEYSDLVGEFLQHLDPKIYVHRLAATASNWEELVAPYWTRHKMASFQEVVSYLKRNQMYQGKKFLQKERI